MINEYAYFITCKNCGRSANIKIRDIDKQKVTRDIICSCCNKIVRKKNETLQSKVK